MLCIADACCSLNLILQAKVATKSFTFRRIVKHSSQRVGQFAIQEHPHKSNPNSQESGYFPTTPLQNAKLHSAQTSFL